MVTPPASITMRAWLGLTPGSCRRKEQRSSEPTEICWEPSSKTKRVPAIGPPSTVRDGFLVSAIAPNSAPPARTIRYCWTLDGILGGPQGGVKPRGRRFEVLGAAQHEGGQGHERGRVGGDLPVELDYVVESEGEDAPEETQLEGRSRGRGIGAAHQEDEEPAHETGAEDARVEQGLQV